MKKSKEGKECEGTGLGRTRRETALHQQVTFFSGKMSKIPCIFQAAAPQARFTKAWLFRQTFRRTPAKRDFEHVVKSERRRDSRTHKEGSSFSEKL